MHAIFQHFWHTPNCPLDIKCMVHALFGDLFVRKDLGLGLASKGGSPQKFRKSQIPKFAHINNLLDMSTFRKCCTLRICGTCLLNV
jgi:hypothetical protein